MKIYFCVNKPRFNGDGGWRSMIVPDAEAEDVAAGLWDEVDVTDVVFEDENGDNPKAGRGLGDLSWI